MTENVFFWMIFELMQPIHLSLCNILLKTLYFNNNQNPNLINKNYSEQNNVNLITWYSNAYIECISIRIDLISEILSTFKFQISNKKIVKSGLFLFAIKFSLVFPSSFLSLQPFKIFSRNPPKKTSSNLQKKKKRITTKLNT